MVLDDVGGRWLAVTVAPGTCDNTQTDYWDVLSLQPQPDGTLVGDRISLSLNGCEAKQQVTFKKTAEIPTSASIADPSAEQARKTSPAQGLYGRYHYTERPVNGTANEYDYDIQTYCLRTAERCLTSWSHVDWPNLVFVFADGKWTKIDTELKIKCSSGGQGVRHDTLEFPLPQPAQDPITSLTGRGHSKETGDCPYEGDFDATLNRT
jgi:serine/threonine-protein kinase